MINSNFPSELLPWHKANWTQVWHAKQQNRLPHALLLSGVEGLGKSQFAMTLANVLLCNFSSQDGIACKTCHGCNMLNAKTHPDLMLIEPEESGKKITVDQIRGVIKNANETTLKGGFRVIIINPATAMNNNAANALLKTLEEPPANTLLILISNQQTRLPATIISRCQKVFFHTPQVSETLRWLQQQITDSKIDLQLLLKISNDVPLKALALIENDLLSTRQELYQNFMTLSDKKADPVQLAAKWLEANHLNVVDLLLSWLTDLLRYKLTEDCKNILNVDYKDEIRRLSLRLLKENLIAYIDHLYQTRADLIGPFNLNKQLLLENLFIRWSEYVPS